jgi:hypothetical protein
MKTSTRSGSAAIVTMVLSVLSLVVIATVVAAVRGDDETYRSHPDIDVNSDCIGPDLVITAVTQSSFASSQEFTVYVKNTGSAPAVMNYPKIAGWSAHLSIDGIRKNVRVQGKNFAGTLGIGQTTSSSAEISSDFTLYPYLIVELYVLSNVGECNSTNNRFVFSSLSQ